MEYILSIASYYAQHDLLELFKADALVTVHVSALRRGIIVCLLGIIRCIPAWSDSPRRHII